MREPSEESLIAQTRAIPSGALALPGNMLIVGAPLEDSAARGIGGFEADNTPIDPGALYIVRQPKDE